MNDRRIIAILAAVAAVPLMLAAVAADAAHQRTMRDQEQGSINAVASRLPAPHLALSGGARWLRAPMLEEPGAAFAESPAMPDADPAGGTMSPPRTLWAEELRTR
jgi:hypothetical protein